MRSWSDEPAIRTEEPLRLKWPTSKYRKSTAEREREADGIHRRIADIDAKLLRNDEFLLDGVIERDSYARLKTKLNADRYQEEDRPSRAEQEVAVSFEDVRQAADLMEALPTVWNRAVAEDPTVAYDLVGSIMPEGMAFEDGSIRTPLGPP